MTRLGSSTLEDTDFLYADDVLAAYDVIEEDEPSTSKARTATAWIRLEATLDLCDALRPTLGAIDAFGTESGEGEYARMPPAAAARLCQRRRRGGRRRDRRLSFLCLSLVDAPDELRRRCLATRSDARRYAAVQRFLGLSTGCFRGVRVRCVTNTTTARSLSGGCAAGVRRFAPGPPFSVLVVRRRRLVRRRVWRPLAHGRHGGRRPSGSSSTRLPGNLAPGGARRCSARTGGAEAAAALTLLVVHTGTCPHPGPRRPRAADCP